MVILQTYLQRFFKTDCETAKVTLGLDGKKVILFFGYIRPSKGIEYVIDALPRVIETIPNIIFLVVGKAQDNYFDYLYLLKNKINILNISSYVQFQDYVSEELLPFIFAASDAVVFPYVSTAGADMPDTH